MLLSLVCYALLLYTICFLFKGDCMEGYYCPEGSSSQTANVCTAGSYCGTGVGIATPCPIVCILWSIYQI